MGEAESDGGGDEKPREKSGTLKGVIITAAFTLLGGIIGVLGKGYYDLAIERQKSTSELTLEDKKVTAELNLEKEKFEENKRLERQKLDADLVKLALQASGGNGAETLGFMVQTNLIEDSDIRKGVIAYLESKKPVPQLQTDSRLWFLKEESTQPVKSPDGRITAKGFGDTVVLIDTRTQKAIYSFPLKGIEWIKAMSFSPNGLKLIAVGNNNLLYVLNPEEMDVVRIQLPWQPDSANSPTTERRSKFSSGRSKFSSTKKVTGWILNRVPRLTCWPN